MLRCASIKTTILLCSEPWTRMVLSPQNLNQGYDSVLHDQCCCTPQGMVSMVGMISSLGNLKDFEQTCCGATLFTINITYSVLKFNQIANSLCLIARFSHGLLQIIATWSSYFLIKSFEYCIQSIKYNLHI